MSGQIVTIIWFFIRKMSNRAANVLIKKKQLPHLKTLKHHTICYQYCITP